MNLPRMQRFPTPAGAGESYHLAPERLLAGNPRQTAWVHYASADGRFSAGQWRSEVGKWRIHYTEDEYCCMLEGLSILSSDDGVVSTLRPGDEFVIPRGFRGTWEVVEPTLKRFVIHEPAA